MTRVVRTELPTRSVPVTVAMGSLTIAAAFFAALFLLVALVIPTAFTGNEQTALAAWMAILFLIVAVMLDLYRRYYVPDELIHKKRRPKVVFRREFR